MGFYEAAIVLQGTEYGVMDGIGIDGQITRSVTGTTGSLAK
jgi:hypothetical protein